jgi:tetratricopeptide (TPR) repeat protein
MIKILLAAILLISPLASAAPDDGEVDLLYLKASYYLNSQKANLALKELDKAIAINPEISMLHIARGKSLVAMGMRDQAQKAFEKAISLDPDDPESFLNLGVLVLQSISSKAEEAEKMERAENLLLRAAELDKRGLESRFYLVMMYDRKDDQENKYKYLKEAVAINPNRMDLLKQAGDAAKEFGDIPESMQYYEKMSNLFERFLSRDSDDIRLLMQFGDLSLWETRKFNLAVDAYSRAAAAAEKDESFLAFKIESEIAVATAYYMMADYEKALEVFTPHEQFVLTRFNRSIPSLILTFANSDKWQRAVEIVDMLDGNIRDDKSLKSYLKRLKAMVYSTADQPQKAYEILQKQIEADPANADAYTQLAQTYIDEKEFEKAAGVIKTAYFSIGAENKEVRFVDAVLAERQGNVKKALNILEKIIKEDPGDHLALNFAGYTIAGTGKNLKKAEEYLLAALEYEPNQGSYLDSLGWVYYQRGDMENAEKYLTKAVATKYKSGEVREHLGYLYMKQGKFKLALKEFEAAIANNLADVKDTTEVENEIKRLRKQVGNSK